MSKKKSNIAIVGTGVSGLVAAAYLTQQGYKVSLFERNNRCGGLLQSFQKDGFTFDAGARAIINSGIVKPMLKQLGITMNFYENPVTIGIEGTNIDILSQDSLHEYKNLLEKLYPNNLEDIEKIIFLIKKIMKHMEVLYGIDNPNFKDLKNEKEYIFKTLLPWLPKFLSAVRKINKMNEPVESVLENLSSNRSLTDIINQHFFKNTPYFFALGYFYVYLDYLYPEGGTGQLVKEIQKKIVEWGGEFKMETQIVEVLPSESKIRDKNNTYYDYDYLIWAADLKTLYKIIHTKSMSEKILPNFIKQNDLVLSKRGGDSIFTLFLGVDQPPEIFKNVSTGHFFYTPSKDGLGEIHRSTLDKLIQNFNKTSKQDVLGWLRDYTKYNTFEISIPVLRDSSLAPKGKTGLMISYLFEYDLVKKVKEAGWYDEFKTEIENEIIQTLEKSIYPNLKEKILFKFSSTPLSIEHEVASSEGGITGWSYLTPVPVVNKLTKIGDSVRTPIPYLLQAGQWAYSPAGIPTAILTGWFAAQHIIKNKK